MPVTVVRCNLVEPGATPASLSARHRAAVEMAAYADDRGITTVQTEEHHGVANNWLPSPFVFAGAVFGATRRIAVTVSAVIGPLHDPLRLAEDVAVLDLLSGGRLVTVAGNGYRPEEYAQFGVVGAPGPDPGRGTGDGAQGVDGRAVLPERAPAGAGGVLQGAADGVRHGGLDDDAGRRDTAAARLGGPGPGVGAVRGAFPARPADVRLVAVVGGEVGGEVGRGTVEELREEGVYRIVTPDECVAQGLDNLVLHPLSGGMPVDEGWRSLQLFAERVLPRLEG